MCRGAEVFFAVRVRVPQKRVVVLIVATRHGEAHVGLGPLEVPGSHSNNPRGVRTSSGIRFYGMTNAVEQRTPVAVHDELGTQFFVRVVQKTNVSAQAVEEVWVPPLNCATRPYYWFGRPGVRRRHPEALALRPEGHAAAIRVLWEDVVRVT